MKNKIKELEEMLDFLWEFGADRLRYDKLHTQLVSLKDVQSVLHEDYHNEE